MLIETNFTSANLSDCKVFGVSTWEMTLKDTNQTGLIITQRGKPIIRVDNLEVAQFVYLLLHSEKLRDVIDTIGKKAVLILGRFTPKRLAVLEAIQKELRKNEQYIPILFTFQKPDRLDLTETVVTLAHLSRFVIADLTLGTSIIHELDQILPSAPSVAVQPIIKKGRRPFSMSGDLYRRHRQLLPIYEYESLEQLIAQLQDKIIYPAEEKVKEVRPTN